MEYCTKKCTYRKILQKNNDQMPKNLQNMVQIVIIIHRAQLDILFFTYRNPQLQDLVCENYSYLFNLWPNIWYLPLIPKNCDSTCK